jgi:hypothetical protein
MAMLICRFSRASFLALRFGNCCSKSSAVGRFLGVRELTVERPMYRLCRRTIPLLHLGTPHRSLPTLAYRYLHLLPRQSVMDFQVLDSCSLALAVVVRAGQEQGVWKVPLGLELGAEAGLEVEEVRTPDDVPVHSG